MEKSQNYHLPHLCWVLRGRGVLLLVGMLPGAGTLPPLLQMDSRHLALLLCCGAASVDGRAILRFMGRLIYLSACFRSVWFPKKCRGWLWISSLLWCLAVLGKNVQKCWLGKCIPSKTHVLGLETPPFPHPSEVGAPPCPAMQFSAVFSEHQGKLHCSPLCLVPALQDPSRSSPALQEGLCCAPGAPHCASAFL